MSKLKTTLAFLFGVAAGGAATWYFLRETYEERSEQDISSAKEAFHLREEKLQAEIDELKAQLSGEVDESASIVLASSKIQDKVDINDYARAKYQMYTPPVTSAKLLAEDDAPKADSVEAPYVISPDEFGEMDGYNQISLTYYADGILADERGVIVDDVEEIVGDALDHFGEYEDDSVYCRSDPKRCDYEILKDLRRYADATKNFPHNI